LEAHGFDLALTAPNRKKDRRYESFPRDEGLVQVNIWSNEWREREMDGMDPGQGSGKYSC